MKLLRFLLCLALLGSFACDKEDNQPARPFRMGFTPFPYALSLEAVNYTYENISANSDLINHHFDDGVPWVEALNEQPFHQEILNDWNFRKTHTPLGHKVYVSVSALSPERDGLAKYRSDQANLPLPAPFDTLHFNDSKIKTAYVNYCKSVIEFFTPDYFNMNVEANLLHFLKPAAWSEFLEFHEYVYRELKATYPNLIIFSSVTGAHMIKDFFGGNDHVQQKLAVLQILEHSDVYALSFYPHLSSNLTNPLNEDVLSTLLAVSDKPFAIAETSYPAQTFSINVNGSIVTISSDEQKQDQYLASILKACESRNALFIIHFTLRDYDQLWASIGGKDDLTIAWRDTGLIDENGIDRLAFSSWKKYFSRPLLPIDN
jgi:hypothetical protein